MKGVIQFYLVMLPKYPASFPIRIRLTKIREIITHSVLRISVTENIIIGML